MSNEKGVRRGYVKFHNMEWRFLSWQKEYTAVQRNSHTLNAHLCHIPSDECHGMILGTRVCAETHRGPDEGARVESASLRRCAPRMRDAIQGDSRLALTACPWSTYLDHE